MVNVGRIQAIVKRPTGNPPDDKVVLWFEQTDINNNPDIGQLRYYNWNSNAWELFNSPTPPLVQEILTISTQGQTTFTLSGVCTRPNNAYVVAMGCSTYNGIHFTVGGNVLTWLNEGVELIAGESISIIYQI